MTSYRSKFLISLVAACLLIAPVLADNHYEAMTDEEVSQSLSDQSNEQLTQQLTAIENRLAECDAEADRLSEEISKVLLGVDTKMSAADYLKKQDELAAAKACAKREQRLATLIKKEIFKRLKLTNSDRHLRDVLLQMKNQAIRAQQKLNEVRGKVNALLKQLEAAKPE